MTKRDRTTYLLLWAILGLLPLFMRPMWEPDEGRYAEIPREMLASGDWLTPTLNGVLYFEKPPLQYWISAASMKLFGLNAAAARLPLALAWLILMWCAWRLARRLGARGPIWALVMTATVLLTFVCGQLLTLDALFSSFMVLGLTAALEAVAARFRQEPPTGWTLLTYIALSAAVLTKGPVALVLLVGILGLSLPFAWRDPKLRRAVLMMGFNPLGWLLFFALTAPWFYFVNQANPGHSQFFFIHEHFTRFLTHEHARQGSDNPFLDKFYFLGILAVGMLPWLSHSIVGLKRGIAFVRRSTGPQGIEGALNRWTVATMLMAFAWPLFFFSVSGSKLPPYILPVVVPMLALGCTFEEKGEEFRSLKRIAIELFVLGAIFLIGGFAFAKELNQAHGWVAGLGAAFGLVGLFALFPKHLTAPRWMAALGGCMLALVFVSDKVASAGKDAAPLIHRAPSNAQWISFGVYFQGLPFHTHQRCVVVAGTGELGFGKRQLAQAEQDRWFMEDPLQLGAVAQRMRSEDPSRPVLVLAHREDWGRLPEAHRAEWQELGRNPGMVLARFK
ncbi:MAG: glycosyltransferase family 39 protein [Holophagaceae bacterium]|nr:glycosyltransferase family 39 protein [Holophagaceae bacterium]